MVITYQNVTALLERDTYLALLAPAASQTDRASLLARARRFKEEGATAVILLADGVPVCLAVYRLEGDDEVALLSLATDEAYRRRGFAYELIEKLTRLYPKRRLVAETDDDAVSFYLSCGWWVISLGEVYPGTVRYRCIREPKKIRDKEGWEHA